MKRSNFEETIDPVILTRGENYYTNGFVQAVKQDNNGHYAFTVSGNKKYTVLVDFEKDRDTIRDIQCDCPFIQGPYCKHMAAVLFQLTEDRQRTGKAETAESDQDILNQLDKTDLVQILTDLLDRYPVERGNIFFNYADKTSDTVETDYFKQQIDAVISSYLRPYHTIDYYETMALTDQLEDILENISEVWDVSLVFDSLLYLHKKTVKLIEQSDDSAGSVGGLLRGIEGELSDRLNQETLDTQTRLSLLKKLEKTMNAKIYEGWESLGIDLLTIFLPAAKDTQVRNAFLKLIDKKLMTLDQKNQSYMVSEILKLKGSVIKAYESNERYADFLYAHETNPQIKEDLLEYLLSKQEYGEVLNRLDLKNRSESPYARRQQLSYAYRAYEGLNERDKQIETGKDLIFAGSFEYYEKIKAIAPDPKELYEDIKSRIRGSNAYPIFDLYKKLVIAEQDTEAILQLTENTVHLIEKTFDLLRETYPNESAKLYTRYMYQLAENTSNRKEYNVFCRKLNEYGRLVGHKEKLTIISQLEETYKRRPAMIDELSKIKE